MYAKKIVGLFCAFTLLFTGVIYPMEIDEDYPLHDAAEDGDIQKVKRLLDQGFDGNQKNEVGQTPLFDAARAEDNSFEVTKFLIDNVENIEVNARDDYGFAPLHEAIYGGNFQTAELLLRRSADPNMQTKEGVSALVIAVVTRQPKFVEMLLKNRAAPNIYDKYGNTPLHYAVALGNKSDSDPLTIPAPIEEGVPTEDEKEIVRLLLEYKAPVGYKNLNFQTPLHFAAGWNNLEALELLVDHLTAPDNLAILNYQDRHLGSNTALHYAVMNQNLPMVQTLVAAGADINKKNTEGKTPLNLALEVPAGMAMTAAQQEIAKLLIEIEKEASL